MAIQVFEAANTLGFTFIAGGGGSVKEIQSVYTCDMLGHALGALPRGAAWVTIQRHVNAVAVAMQAEAACIVLVEGLALYDDAKAAAERENVAVLSTTLPAAEAVVALSRLL